MESNLKSEFTDGFSFKNEVKSIMALQLGTKYGFVVEIDSVTGKYYCPLEAYRTKEQAFQVLKRRMK